MDTEHVSYPYDKTFQLKIIALAGRESKFLDQFSDVLNPDYLSTQISASVLRLILTYYSKYKLPPTLDAIRDMIASYCKRFTLDLPISEEMLKIAEQAYNIDLSDGDYVRDKVVEFGRNQAMRSAIIESAKMLQSGEDLDKVRNLVDKAHRVGLGIGGDGLEIFRSLKDLRNIVLSSDTYSKKVITGWPTLDKVTRGGLGAGELGVIVGGYGQGKSMLLVSLAATAAEQAVNTTYITHELSEVDVALRFASRLTGLTIDQILSEEYHTQFQAQVDRLTKFKHYLRVKYMHPNQVNALAIRSYISRIEAVDGISMGLLVNDYADKLLPIDTTSIGDSYLKMGRVFDDLATLGKDFRFPVWTASQYNREGVYNPAAGGTMIADSIQKLYNCDLAIMIQQSVDDRAQGKMRGWLEKDRRGRAMIYINWNVDYDRMLITESTPMPVSESTQVGNV